MKVVKQSRTPELRPEGTPVGNFRTFSVSREVDVNANPTDAAIVEFLGNGKHVLELGCGSGHMSRTLCDRDCPVVGIEIDRPAAEAAAEHCRRVIAADLDYLDFDHEIGPDRFDVIVAADVLEHLKDPVSVLKGLRQFLSPQGYLVTSIPNVAHLSVRLALLQGRFPYGANGVLDRTHLRFFTLESIERLLDDAGFVIGQIHRTQKLPADPASFEVPYDTSTIPAGILERLSHEPEASTYQ